MSSASRNAAPPAQEPPRHRPLSIVQSRACGPPRRQATRVGPATLQRDAEIAETPTRADSNTDPPAARVSCVDPKPPATTSCASARAMSTFRNRYHRGKELTVSFRTTVSEVLDEGAYADVAVNIGLVKVLRKQYDLCEEARNLNTSIQCPAQQGEYYVEHTFDLAKTIPEAKFNIKVRGFTVKEEPLVCLDLVVDFIRRHD
ncbi:Phosphatidylglycerol/phosphatidylinositol transfer protein [Vanrija pseudolonga]|uniref:Phosphatidylglycerol/phosphatidylinositol transfer protein n=1 Tax=Vanrija pseudolonga TaxID=143232 RepID=A0AAF0Y3J4_9TREE|nr:Phosphatidylglycerol/phosphatidylinositol transfer protein [Vanrija pseudolonga]